MDEIELLEIKWIIFVDFMLGKDMRGMKRKYRDYPFNVEEAIRECAFKFSQEHKTIRAKKPK